MIGESGGTDGSSSEEVKVSAGGDLQTGVGSRSEEVRVVEEVMGSTRVQYNGLTFSFGKEQ